MTLRSKTIHALIWSFFEFAGLRIVQFCIGIVLARLLFPEQYGLIGMLSIFMAVAHSFVNSGFGSALVQKQNVTQVDICSIFYFNILVGFLAACILCAIAPLIAAFYNQPALTQLTRAMSLIIVIDSFALIQRSLLSKKIDFKTSTKVGLTASLTSGVVGIAMAYSGFGVWSLVAQQLAASFVNAVLLWVFNSWRPAWVFSLSSLRSMFGFGSRLLISGLLNQIFANIYLLVIGKVYSAADLGFYTNAKKMQQTPAQTIGGMVGRVTFPVFSTIQDDLPRVKRNLKKALTTVALVNFPVMIGLAVVGRPFILVLLTDKWEQSIPYFQLLCIVGILFPIHLINLNVLQALGRSDLFLRLEIIKKVLIVVNILITIRIGISEMIMGMIVLSILSFALNTCFNGKLIGYPMKEQIVDLSPYFLASLFMGACVSAVGFIEIQNNLGLLSIQVALGCVMYVAFCRFMRLQAFMEIYEEGLERIRLGRGRFQG